MKSFVIKLSFLIFSLFTYCFTLFSELRAESTLPPNWRSGGSSKEVLQPRYSMEEAPERKRASKKAKDAAGDWSVGMTAGVPELLRFDLRKSFNPNFDLLLSIGPAWPFDITVEMPSDVIKSDKSNTLAAAYTSFDAKFKANWGPHLQLGGSWFPFGGSWLLFGAGGYREFSIKGEAQSQIRVCTIAEAAKEPPCGNDQAAIQTRNSLQVKTKARVQSMTCTLATGWLWNAGESWEVLLLGGATKAIKNSYQVDVEAAIVDPDGVPQELDAALLELKSKSEQDVKTKATTELERLQETLLPVLSIGLAYRF